MRLARLKSAMDPNHHLPPSPDKSSPQVVDEAAALQHIIAELSAIPDDAKLRIVRTVCMFFGLSRGDDEGGFLQRPSRQTTQIAVPEFRFSEDNATPSVKQFLADKAPTTDVERVACLAYYLTHFRSTQHFKTKDITELNTEAAQRKFSNTAVAVDNATKAGFLVPSIKGCKQLSASGERFVELLPDREAAKLVVDRPKRGRSKKSSQRK